MRQWKCTTSSILSLFSSSSFSSSSPPFSLSLLALSTHCHHQFLYCFCCFKPTAPRETSRHRDTVSACQPASANPSGEKKCAKCSDHRKLFLSGCFADLRSVMCVSAAASICDCCCCNDDVYFEAAAAATLQSA